jgi:zinc transport system ATP-binding protein
MAVMTKPYLLVNNLTISRNQHDLITNFSGQFNAGEIYALTGDNGSGKTTLLKTLAGLLSCKREQIFIDGHDLATIKSQKRAQIISVLLQQIPEQHYASVKSRIAHGLMPDLGFNHFLTDNYEKQIKEMAQRLNIAHLLNRPLAKISGGEQRLVHIAKCLMGTTTKILLLDEPSVFLDFRQQDNLINNLKEQAQNDRLIIFSSHDAEFIRKCAQSMILIQNQRISLIGT